MIHARHMANPDNLGTGGPVATPDAGVGAERASEPSVPRPPSLARPQSETSFCSKATEPPPTQGSNLPGRAS